MSGARRVLVTGLGVVSPLGPRLEPHLHALFAGATAIAPIAGDLARDLPFVRAATVRGFDPRATVEHRLLRKVMQPSGAFAVAAAREALAMAGLQGDDTARAACGLYLGSGSFELPPEFFRPALLASARDGRLDLARFVDVGMAALDPLLIVKGLPNAALCGVSIEHGLRGPNANLVSGGAGGVQAVAAAAAAIRCGDADLALAGGADALVQPQHVIELLVRGQLASGADGGERACRPFDRRRSGLWPGEGAALVLLEEAEHAQARGARACGELLGAGDAFGERGLEDAAREALDEAGARDVDGLFALGLGGVDHDRREAEAACRAAPGQPLTAATGALGYTGAAAGAFALVHALAGLARGALPPTAGCDEPDPLCAADVVRAARPGSYRRLLVWASERGTRHAALVVGAAP